MLRSALFIFFLLSAMASRAEPDSLRLIGIHPALGRTIDRDEKIKYHLFADYPDAQFYQAQFFSHNDTSFQVVITSVSGSRQKYAVSYELMDALYDQVDAVDETQIKDPEIASNIRDGIYAETPGKNKREQNIRILSSILNIALYILLALI